MGSYVKNHPYFIPRETFDIAQINGLALIGIELPESSPQATCHTERLIIAVKKTRQLFVRHLQVKRSISIQAILAILLVQGRIKAMTNGCEKITPHIVHPRKQRLPGQQMGKEILNAILHQLFISTQVQSIPVQFSKVLPI